MMRSGLPALIGSAVLQLDVVFASLRLHTHTEPEASAPEKWLSEKDPSKDAAYLTGRQLSDTDSIDCLLRKQHGQPCVKISKHDHLANRNVPNIPDLGPVKPWKEKEGWWVGTYPDYTDKETCHSGGERFCDPDDVLNATERCQIERALNHFSNNHNVACAIPGTGNREQYPFFLGVAVVRRLPDQLLDENSMKRFGDGVMARWHLLDDRGCPNSAVLVISSETEEAVVASSSCEFICESRGGNAVALRMKEELVMAETSQGGSPVSAILGGIHEFGPILKENNPLLDKAGVGLPDKRPELTRDLAEKIDGWEEQAEGLTGGYTIKEAPVSERDRRDLPTYLAKREGTYALAQRGVFAVICGSCFLIVLYFSCHAFSGDCYRFVKDFSDDFAPHHIPDELKKAAPRWGAQSGTYHSCEHIYVGDGAH